MVKKPENRQIEKDRQTPLGKAMDKNIKAKKPGKRISRTGHTYYEHRSNRTDLKWDSPKTKSTKAKAKGKSKRRK